MKVSSSSSDTQTDTDETNHEYSYARTGSFEIPSPVTQLVEEGVELGHGSKSPYHFSD